MTTGAVAVERRTATLTLGVGVAGRTALTFALAGGVLLGGAYVGAMGLLGRTSGHALLVTAVPFYAFGILAGFVTGAVAGLTGRGRVTRVDAARGVRLAALYLIGLAPIVFVPAGWMAMTAAALYLGRPAALIGTTLGWLTAGAIVHAALDAAARVTRNVLAR